MLKTICLLLLATVLLFGFTPSIGPDCNPCTSTSVITFIGTDLSKNRVVDVLVYAIDGAYPDIYLDSCAVTDNHGNMVCPSNHTFLPDTYSVSVTHMNGKGDKFPTPDANSEFTVVP